MGGHQLALSLVTIAVCFTGAPSITTFTYDAYTVGSIRYLVSKEGTTDSQAITECKNQNGTLAFFWDSTEYWALSNKLSPLPEYADTNLRVFLYDKDQQIPIILFRDGAEVPADDWYKATQAQREPNRSGGSTNGRYCYKITKSWPGGTYLVYDVFYLMDSGCDDNCRFICELDEDECTDGTAGCAHGCENFMYSYNCTCEAGYSLATDRHKCDDNDECNDGTVTGCSHNCVNMPATFECACPDGYSMTSDKKTCKDIDECSAVDRGNCTQGCTNTVGSYNCSCTTGYILNSTDLVTCEDIDECTDGTITGCSNLCVNTAGSYHCSCPDGYTMGSDQKNCEDIDECSTAERGGCSDSCNNTVGGYVCGCPTGYVLNATDLQTCEDVDECGDGSNGGCSHTCINTAGTYSCGCPPGYSLDSDKTTCSDIDECQQSSTACAAGQQCQNTAGAFTCTQIQTCESGFTWDSGTASCEATPKAAPKLCSCSCAHLALLKEQNDGTLPTTPLPYNRILDTSELSSTVRKKTSASDDRSVATGMGAAGSAILVCVFFLIVASDLVVACRYLGWWLGQFKGPKKTSE